MASFCKVTIVGNVGRDPEQRYTPNGTMVVSFSVAVNNRRRNPDGSFQEETEWFRITCFGRQAEFAQQYITKGRVVFVDGRLRVDRWTGQDGSPRYTLDVVASDVQTVDPRPRDEGGEFGGQPSNVQSMPSRPARPAPQSDPSDLEDLPF